MCGRITQYHSADAYANEIGWSADDCVKHDWRLVHDCQPSWNVAPGKSPLVMSFFDDLRRLDPLHWGYKPPWDTKNEYKVLVNARIETAAHSPMFRGMLTSGRIIVPADGYFEWTGERHRKIPWYFRLKSDKPLFLAAMSYTEPAQGAFPNLGFVILTQAARGAIADIHERRPVVFSPADAQAWMDPGMSAEQAEQFVRKMAIDTDLFAWYRVSTDVNSVANNDAYLIAPISR